jgi:molybdopterin guanine dinucleotide-containing S/N-oxide reductase-like protein
VVDAPGEARSDYEILSDLARRLGPEVEETFTEGRDEMGWLRHFWDRARERAAVRDLIMPTFEEFWQAGVYEFPPRERDYVYLADFRADPERYDLGTPSGKIELYSQTIAGFGYDDCPPHPTWMEPAEWLSPQAEAEGALHLISSHPQYRLHSQLDQGPVSRAAKVAEREPLWLNPLDAEARGIADGDVVEVFNDRGRMLAGAVVTARIRPGVVMMHEGAWYDPQDRGQIGTLDKHGQVNLVTLDIPSSRLGQGCAAQTCLVRVARFGGTPPPVTAFDPPPGVAV